MERRTFSVLGWGLVAAFAAMFVAQVGTSMLMSDELYYSSWGSLILSLLGYVACVGVFWLITRKLPRADGIKKTIRAHQYFGFLLVDMGLTYILSFAGSWLDGLLHILINGSDTSSNPVSGMLEDLNLAAIFIMTCVLAPVFEELVFRKILLDRLRPFGDTVAILYSAIAFALFHMNVQQTMYTLSLGLLGGYLVVRTGNWLYGVLLHAGGNFIGGMVPTLLEISNSDTLYGLFTLAIFGSMIAAVVLIAVNARRVWLNPPPQRFSRPVGALAVGNTGTIIYILVSLGMILYTIWIAGL